MASRLAAFGVAWVLVPFSLAAQTPVDVELVLAVDVSQSMDRGELALQRQGYIDAVRHPEVLRAIRGGMYGRAAITYVEWGAAQSVMTRWALIEDAAGAVAFAEALATSDVPAGVVNVLTGDAGELTPWLAAHMDVNAVDLTGAPEELVAGAQESAAENVKRVIRSEQVDAQSPYLIAAFSETKTVWHPKGM